MSLSTLNAAENASWPIEVVDPNPSLLTEAGQVISTDTAEAVDRLAGELPARVGLIADGVSQLLLRLRTSNVVNFSISPRAGQLRSLAVGGLTGHKLAVTPVSSSTGESWAFALFEAPDDLPGAMVRQEVIITARASNRVSSVRLRLENPPVLLLHGLWSSSAAWDGLKGYLQKRNFRVCEGSDCTVNYGSLQPAPSFDPFATEPQQQFAINHLIEKTTNTLNAVRASGLAAAQVDIVAHSLGGLIARARVAVPDAERAYRRRENFYRGDFHKLITVGTPHRGTPVADFLVSNRCERAAFLEDMRLEDYMAAIGFPLGRAVEEMRTVSAALTNLGSTAMVPSHAIVGLAPKRSGTEQLLDSLPGALGFFVTLDGMLGGNGQHDTLVTRESQAGGLSKPAVTLARSVVHSDVAPIDVSETESRLVWRRIARLLRLPTASKVFGTFTALQTNAVPATPPCE